MLRAQFPEAAGVSDILCNAMLASAAIEIGPQAWGPFGAPGQPQTIADQGQLYLAMHKLATSPFGAAAKVAFDPKGAGYDRSTYGKEFKRLMLSVTSGFRVA